MSEKTITITEKEFQKAVMKADEKWQSIGEETGNNDPMKRMMMSMHNVLFGTLIENVLFNESEDEE